MTLLRVFLSRALDLLLGPRRDRRLDAEVELHVSLLVEEGLARGLTPEEARIAARRRFGGVDQVKTRCRDQRGLPGLDALGQDVRFAWRVLRRERGFALTAVLVLALGIGVNNMMFTVLNAHTIRGLPLPDPDRVVHVSTRDASAADRGLSWPEFEELRRASASADLGAFVSGAASIGSEHEAPERVDRTYVSAGTFDLLGIAPFVGRGLTAADARPGAPAVALVGERLWRSRYHADPAVVGRPVLIDGVPSIIVGVVRRASGFPAVADLWQPLETMPGLPQDNRAARALRVVGRVRPGIDVASSRAELETLFASGAAAHSDTGAGIRAYIVTINERVLGRVNDPAWLAFMAVGCLVALISCANVANLLLGRALHRDREIALRTSLGATRGRIVRQLLIESMLLASGGALVGLALGVAGVTLFSRAIPPNTLPYWMDYSVDRRVIAALVLVSAVATLAFGLLPALQASRSDPQAALRQGGPTVAHRRTASRWATGFLVAEIGLGVVMLANLGLGWQVARASIPTDARLYADDVLAATVTLPASGYRDAETRREFLRGLERRLEGAPGLMAAAATTSLPVRSAPERQIRARDVVARDPLRVRSLMIGPDYFDALGVALLSGRGLTADDARGTRGVVVNEHLARALFQDRDPLGERVAFVTSADDQPGEWLTIVGVTPAIRQRPSAEAEAVIYEPIDTSPPATVSFLVRTGLGPDAVAGLLRRAVMEIDPHLPLYGVATLGRATRDAEWNGRVSSWLLLTLTVVAVSLAGVGLYAVTARAVAERRREIGVRVAIGASPVRICRMILRQAAGRAATGALFGVLLVIAWDAVFAPSARARTAVPGASLTDPYVFLGIASALALITVLACLAPVRRVMSLNPAAAIEEE